MDEDKNILSEQDIIDEVSEILVNENKLIELEQSLNANEQFRAYLDFKAEFETKSSQFWKKVETQMIDNKIKSVKGDWGSLTIAERSNFDIDEELLPKKFYKKVIDTKLISDTYKLSKKLPKGVNIGYTRYLTKRFKNNKKVEN